MTRVVVDASVLVKCFLPEEDSEEANRLFSGVFVLLAPDLLFAEVGNVIRKHVVRGTMTADAARIALEALDSIALAAHPIGPLTGPALEIAIAHDLSVYEAVYVALAFREGCPLVTADARLCRTFAASPLSGIAVHVSDFA